MSSGCCGWFRSDFRLCFCGLGDADFASPKEMYLSFYWTVSSHFSTVMYQIMLVRIQEYGSLGVSRALWIVLGWFSNSFLLFWRC